MKIKVDFKALWAVVDRLDAHGIAGLDVSAISADERPTARHQTINKKPKKDNFGNKGGLLVLEGLPVVLYMPKQWHGQTLESITADTSKGYKFHLTNCSTIRDMQSKNEFHRYIATNRNTGHFDIEAKDKSGLYTESTAKLNVCRNCLSHINYKGYSTEKTTSAATFENFNLPEFFATYSTLYEPDIPPPYHDKNPEQYTADWKEVSQRYRASHSYCCEQCAVDLRNNKNLLHTHHINRNKTDNRNENLQALCADCHRKQPHHGHMYVLKKDMTILTRLRNAQEIIDGEWETVLQYADTALHGLLMIYRKERYNAPEIGFDILSKDGEIVATAAVAWSADKFAITTSEEEVRDLQKLGWQAETLGDALEQTKEQKNNAA